MIKKYQEADIKMDLVFNTFLYHCNDQEIDIYLLHVANEHGPYIPN